MGLCTSCQPGCLSCQLSQDLTNLPHPPISRKKRAIHTHSHQLPFGPVSIRKCFPPTCKLSVLVRTQFAVLCLGKQTDASVSITTETQYLRRFIFSKNAFLAELEHQLTKQNGSYPGFQRRARCRTVRPSCQHLLHRTQSQ